MVVTEEEEKLQKSQFEVTWTDEESGVAKKAKKVRTALSDSSTRHREQYGPPMKTTTIKPIRCSGRLFVLVLYWGQLPQVERILVARLFFSLAL